MIYSAINCWIRHQGASISVAVHTIFLGYKFHRCSTKWHFWLPPTITLLPALPVSLVVKSQFNRDLTTSNQYNHTCREGDKNTIKLCWKTMINLEDGEHSVEQWIGTLFQTSFMLTRSFSARLPSCLNAIQQLIRKREQVQYDEEYEGQMWIRYNYQIWIWWQRRRGATSNSQYDDQIMMMIVNTRDKDNWTTTD